MYCMYVRTYVHVYICCKCTHALYCTSTSRSTHLYFSGYSPNPFRMFLILFSSSAGSSLAWADRVVAEWSGLGPPPQVLLHPEVTFFLATAVSWAPLFLAAPALGGVSASEKATTGTGGYGKNIAAATTHTTQPTTVEQEHYMHSLCSPATYIHTYAALPSTAGHCSHCPRHSAPPLLAGLHRPPQESPLQQLWLP